MDYAAPEYVEIAVLELLIAETQYSLLNKRYKLLLGINKEYPLFESPPPNRETSSFFLKDNLRSHAFCGTLLKVQQKIKT